MKDENILCNALEAALCDSLGLLLSAPSSPIYGGEDGVKKGAEEPSHVQENVTLCPTDSRTFVVRRGVTAVPEQEDTTPLALFQSWRPPVFRFIEKTPIPDQSLTVASASALGPSAPDSTATMTLTVRGLKSAMLVGQAGAKFLILRMDSTLVAVDQHAAHERIRLEAMQRMEKGVTFFDPPLPLALSPDQQEQCRIHREALEARGFSLAFGKGGTNLYSVPRLLFTHDLNIADFLEYLQCLAECGGSRAVEPPAFLRVLSSRACNGAIRFGDVLSRQQSTELVQKLSLCTFPFQCAHGRPSAAPVFDISILPTLIPRMTAVERRLMATSLQDISLLPM